MCDPILVNSIENGTPLSAHPHYPPRAFRRLIDYAYDIKYPLQVEFWPDNWKYGPLNNYYKQHRTWMMLKLLVLNSR